jgi:hypothetical protein
MTANDVEKVLDDLAVKMELRARNEEAAAREKGIEGSSKVTRSALRHLCVLDHRRYTSCMRTLERTVA